MLDNIDQQILYFLKKNARISWKDIGAQVHLTGQAVAARIAKMTDEGIIRSFTIDINSKKIGIGHSGFITVYMKTNDHEGFLEFVRVDDGIVEASRISGAGCYLLKFKVKTEEDLNLLLKNILLFGNYRLSIIVGVVKR